MASPPLSKKKSKTKTKSEKLPSGVYRNNGSLWIRYTDENRKQKRESAHTDNVDVAHAFLIRKRNEVLANKHPVAAVILGEVTAKSLTYSQFLNDKSIGYYACIKYQAQYRTVKYCLDDFSRYFGNFLVRDIGIRELSTYRNMKSDENIKLSSATLNRHRSYVLASLTHAASHKLYSKPALRDLREDFEKRPEIKKKKRAFSVTHLHAILDAALKYPHLHQIICFAIASGLRKGKIYRLEWSHVNFEENEILSPPKDPNGTWVTTIISDPIREILDERLKVKLQKCPYVFWNPKTLTKWSDLKESWWNVLDEAGLRPRRDKRALAKKIATNNQLIKDGFEPTPDEAAIVIPSMDKVFHSLRHTFASHLHKKKVPLETVRKLLGHSTIQTTQRYLDDLTNIQDYKSDVDGLGDILLHTPEQKNRPKFVTDEYGIKRQVATVIKPKP